MFAYKTIANKATGLFRGKLSALDCLDDGARYWALENTSRISLSKNHLKSLTTK